MNPYDNVIKGLKFGVPRIIRLFCHDLREKAPTGRFNTLSGFLYGFNRLHSFSGAYRWCIANGYKKPSCTSTIRTRKIVQSGG